MKYSEQQLKAWTSPLSQSEEQRAENTIRMIKAAMDANSQLRSLDYEVFVQGSYANNTNVRTDSDVDVCVMLKSTFYMELPSGKTREDYNIGPGTMEFQQYRDLVKQALQDKFGRSFLTDGNKSLKVRENTYHVQADVVPAFQHRNYAYVNSKESWNYIEGTKFFAKDGREVTNYPKVHIQNGTAKNKMDRYLLMLAEVHNWGLKCAPCWESTTWRVFSDRAYVVESQYMRKPDEDELQRITSYAQLITTKKKRGKMRMSSFEKMLAAMETDPWRTPGLDIQACDGEGWKIEMYKCIRTEAEGKYEFLKSKKLQHFLNSTKETPN